MIVELYRKIVPSSIRERIYTLFLQKILRTVRGEKVASLQKRVSFYAKFVSKGDMSFDIGANVGNRIEPMLSLGVKVIAVEPQERCVTLLKEKFGDKIVVVQKGICSEIGIRDFYINESHSGISTFSEEFIQKTSSDRHNDNTWKEPVKIQMTTLDNLIDEYGVPVFIKIDVEGFEVEVLKGLTKPIRYISFEYTFPVLVDNAVKCIEILSRLADYQFNYSVSESMELALDNWVSGEEMSVLIGKLAASSDRLRSGDIYAMLKI